MPPLDRLRQIDALLEAALDLPPDARAAFLADATDDATLRAEVEALLAHEEDASRFLDRPAAEHAAALLADAPAPHEDAAQPLPARIGPYAIVRELGRGGMGSVFLARRDDDTFDKHVALKIIRRGLDTEDILSRFHYERQILAALDHPHIATLHDGGMTDDGRPYFVMEYVDGLPITDYADAHRLSTDQRLALFRTVCRAVQHAHQNLVIHRDLKPSNILVTEDGTVKLLDFGIAKLLSDEGIVPDQTAPLTRTGVRLMTPEYAAPEQVKGEAITTATDVYQLGVLLYELLTGQRPYRIGQRVEAEIARVILEEVPTRPSTAIAETGGATAEVRGTSIERLRRRLSGDLDNIVLKALAKESGRRYGTVEQLSEDIRRHRVGLPVAARAATVGYRMKKFVVRHRGQVAVAAVMVLMLIGYAVTVSVQSARIAAERDRARIEATKARQVADFMTNLFREAKPSVAGSEVATVRDALDAGARLIRTELADEPAVQAALMTEIGRSYINLGNFREADTLLQAALELRKQVFGERHREVAGTLFSLGEVKDAIFDVDAAEAYHRASIAMYRDLLGPADNDTLAQALASLGGIVSRDRKDYANGLPLLQEAADMMERLYERDPEDTERRRLAGWSISFLALGYQTQGDHEEAEANYRRAIALFEAHDDHESTTLLDSRYLLGRLFLQNDRLEEAEAVFNDLIPQERLIYGPDHIDHAYTLEMVGSLYQKQGRPAEAVAMFRRADELRTPVLGGENLLTLWNRTLLAQAYADVGKPDSAAIVYRESLAACRRMAPECSRADIDRGNFLDILLIGYGKLMLAQNQPARAEAMYLEALAIREAQDNTEGMAEAHERLVDLYDAWGKPAEAARYRALRAAATP